ncbi:hypothetical protein M3484_09640 [Pseudomonas sp. GX19020]|uniref:hypothetical protein n=1 Tax=Pseudomonas sp. GX19020 TaxID=2942277 RepID=UPI00201A15C9|nr:hypothetical protein [Pseudomonas sp. GX19020]MCL4066833.1 hypothetical protein [Pseudomonas sp. GX19020]
MDFLKSLLSPEVTASLAGLLVAMIGLILTVAPPILIGRIYRWTGVRIEEKHTNLAGHLNHSVKPPVDLSLPSPPCPPATGKVPVKL